MRIVVPSQLTPESVAVIAAALRNRAGEKVLELDFTRIRFVYPAGTISLLIAVQDLLSERDMLGLTTELITHPSDAPGMRYLHYFGFFDALGLRVPHFEVGQKSEAGRYFLITKLERHELQFKGVPIQEKLEQVCREVTKILLGEDDEDIPLVQAVWFSLREAIRNVFEHSLADEAYLTAQSWPANGAAEFALGDGGIGIRQALSAAFDLESGQEALKMAILPGITEYQGRETSDKWQNSGYGLFMLSEIAKEFGRLSIASSASLLNVDSRGVEVKAAPGLAHGTTVGMRMSVPSDIYWANFLERTRLAGEEKAKRIKGARVKASRSSGGLW